MNPANGSGWIRERQDGTAEWQVGILGERLVSGQSPDIKDARRQVQKWRRRLRSESGEDGRAVFQMQKTPDL